MVSSSHKTAKFQSLSYPELEGPQDLLKDFAKPKRCPTSQEPGMRLLIPTLISPLPGLAIQLLHVPHGEGNYQ